jgi:hypothetical protein
MTHNFIEEMFQVPETLTSHPVRLGDPKFRSPLGTVIHFDQFEQLGMHHPLAKLRVRHGWILRMG